MLGHAAVVGPRGDDHRDAQLRGRLHIDAVIADAGAPDDLELLTAAHGLLVHGALVGHPDNEGVRVLQLIEIVVGMRVMRNENLRLSLQKRHALGADGLCHGNLHKSAPPFP